MAPPTGGGSGTKTPAKAPTVDYSTAAQVAAHQQANGTKPLSAKTPVTTTKSADPDKDGDPGDPTESNPNVPDKPTITKTNGGFDPSAAKSGETSGSTSPITTNSNTNSGIAQTVTPAPVAAMGPISTAMGSSDLNTPSSGSTTPVVTNTNSQSAGTPPAPVDNNGQVIQNSGSFMSRDSSAKFKIASLFARLKSKNDTNFTREGMIATLPGAGSATAKPITTVATPAPTPATNTTPTTPAATTPTAPSTPVSTPAAATPTPTVAPVTPAIPAPPADMNGQGMRNSGEFMGRNSSKILQLRNFLNK